MAGLGFKDFAVGEVLTAADVDGYLMQQTVMRFADAGARGSALGTATGTAVPLAEGMVAYLDDANRLDVYTGTAWSAVSKVQQIVYGESLAAQTTTSSTYADVTDLTATITPTSSSSVMLVRANIFTSTADSANQNVGEFQITDGSNTNLWVRSGPTDTYFQQFGGGLSAVLYNVTAEFVHAPATTSAFTYKVRFRSSNNVTAVRVNATGNNTATARSIITVTEIAP